MTKLATRTVLLLLAGYVAGVHAQPQPRQLELDDRDGYRKSFTKPETAAQYWAAIKFELETGRFDFAAEHLHTWQGHPTYSRAALQKIYEQEESTVVFLRMSTIKDWYLLKNLSPRDRIAFRTSEIARKQIEDGLKKLNDQAKADAAKLLNDVMAAIRDLRGDRATIRKHVANLSASREERGFALQRLINEGAQAVPHYIELMEEQKRDERLELLRDLLRRDESGDYLFGGDIVPPFVAALDMEDKSTPLLVPDILFFLKNRPEFWQRRLVDPVPYLWKLAAPNYPNDLTRKMALELLAKFYELPIERLPSAEQALTDEAERYYQRQVRKLQRQNQITFWNWQQVQQKDKQGKVTNVLMSVAEVSEPTEAHRRRLVEHFSKQALQIKPDYRPAQMVFLSFAINEGFQLPAPGPVAPPPPGPAPAGPAPMGNPVAQPLAQAQPQPPPTAPSPTGTIDPKLKSVLSKLSTDLLMDLIERGLRTNDTKIILAPVQVLGERKQVEAAFAGPQGDNLLQKALLHGDPRVQFAAAESLLRIPGALTPQTREQIVEVFRRMIEAEISSSGQRKAMIAVPERKLATRLAEIVSEAGYAAVVVESGRDVLDHVLHKADVDLLFLDPRIEKPGYEKLLAVLRNDRFAHRLPIFMPAVPNSKRSDTIRKRRRTAEEELAGLVAEQTKQLTQQEQRILEYRVGKALAEKPDRETVARLNRIEQLKQYLAELIVEHDKERAKRFKQLQVVTRDRHNVFILDDRFVEDPFYVGDELRNALVQANYVPLTEVERAAYAGKALEWLDKIARGELNGFGKPGKPARAADADAHPFPNLEDVLLKAMISPKLDFPARTQAVSIVSHVPGTNPQRALINLALKKEVVRDPKDVATQKLLDDLRAAAIEALQRHLQVYGFPTQRQTERLRSDVVLALRDPSLGAGVKQALALLDGNLKKSSRGDGAEILNLNP